MALTAKPRRSWRVESWTVAEVHELAKLIVAAGDSPLVGRVLGLLEVGAISVREATAALLRRNGPAPEGSAEITAGLATF